MPDTEKIGVIEDRCDLNGDAISVLSPFIVLAKLRKCHFQCLKSIDLNEPNAARSI